MNTVFLTLLIAFGGWEIFAVCLAILLLFGGRKIPELMKGLGGGIKEFKKASKADPDEEDVNKTNQNIENKG